MKLFEPARIAKVEMRNRTVMAPMATNFGAPNGAVTPRQIAYYAERAKGGTGLIIVEGTCVSPPEGKGWACEIGLDKDSMIPGHMDLTETVHSYGAKIFVQLHHAGRQTNLGNTDGTPLVVPTAQPQKGGVPPHELTTAEVKALVGKHVAAAERAKRAGYDGVEVHGAHGYLTQQFLSPMTNQRTDEYGGSLENRMRFSLEIIAGIKQTLGRDFPVGLRMSAEGGYTFDDGKLMAKRWEEAGLDVLHVSFSGIGPTTVAPKEESPLAHKEGWIVHFAEGIKALVKIPVITVGEIRHAQFAASIVEEGKADFVALGRTLISDPAWTNKARSGHYEDIRRCISCGWCLSQLFVSKPVHCIVNPEAGREVEMAEIRPAAKKKKVMVVGGGAAGMEAARVAALRGHNVTLYEKEKELGAGTLKLAATPPGKEKIKWVREDLETKLKKLSVKTQVGVKVDRALVEKEAPDALIVATGARPAEVSITGLDKAHVVTAHDVLAGKAQVRGKKAAILGGWQTGCETAEYLASKGYSVTIIARSSRAQMAGDAIPGNRAALFGRLALLNVEILSEYDVRYAQPNGLMVVSKDGKERFVEAETVVLARGVTPDRAWAEGLEERIAEVYYIGDCNQPAGIAEATYQGAVVARRI